MFHTGLVAQGDALVSIAQSLSLLQQGKFMAPLGSKFENAAL